ncbi:MAG: NAD-dependent epimerase/dehydratase family protein [Bacteroidota bacterium]
MKAVLVTGANGLLATHTVLELLRAGYRVRALVRNRSKFTLAGHPSMEIVEGDITDLAAMQRVVAGCQYVVHAAAETRQGLTDYAAYERVNVQGTKNVVEAAAEAGVLRVVHVSTCNVFGFGTAHQPGNEAKPPARPFSDSGYVKSKLEAQQVAFSYSDRTEVVAVNPTFILGAYDQKPSSGRIILMGYRKRVLFYPPGGKNFVYARDAAQAMVNALAHGNSGEAYILAGENLSYKEFFQKLNAQAGQTPILIGLPKAVLIAVGRVGNLLKRLGLNTETTLTNMRILCLKNYYSHSKAKEALEVEFQGVDGAIQEAVHWFRQHGYLK